jgi:hypothetical protein
VEDAVNKEDYQNYVEGFYNVNPEELEDELVRTVKAYFTFSVLEGESHVDQLVAKDYIKRVSAQAFLLAKADGATDNKAKESVHVASTVIDAKKDYFKKLRIWEENKAQKETTVMKKQSLCAIGFNRNTDAKIEDYT